MTGARLAERPQQVETAPANDRAKTEGRARSTPGPDAERCSSIRGKHYVQQVEPTDENVLTAEHTRVRCTGPLG